MCVYSTHEVERLQARQQRRLVGRAAPRALRLARRSGRVDHGAADVAAAAGRDAAGIARPHEVLEVRGPRAPRAADRDPVAHPRRARPHGVRDREERIAHEHHRGVGIVQDVGDLVGDEPVIHRHRDRAGGAHGGAGEQVLERVRRVHDRVLARAQAELHQRVGEAVAALEVLAPGDRAVALDDGGRVGLGGGVGRDDVHWPALCSKTVPEGWPTGTPITPSLVSRRPRRATAAPTGRPCSDSSGRSSSSAPSRSSSRACASRARC
jgi:hypothetical protein